MKENIIESGMETIIQRDDVIMLSCASSNLSKQFLKINRAPLGLISPGLRWVSDDDRTYIVEHAPNFKIVDFYEYNDESIQGIPLQYAVPVPWLIYAIQFEDASLDKLESVSVFCR